MLDVPGYGVDFVGRDVCRRPSDFLFGEVGFFYGLGDGGIFFVRNVTKNLKLHESDQTPFKVFDNRGTGMRIQFHLWMVVSPNYAGWRCISPELDAFSQLLHVT